LTVLVLNLRHVLYGLSLSRQLATRFRPPLPLLAFLLTDEAYGVTIKDGLDGRGGPRLSLRARLRLYGACNLAPSPRILAATPLHDPQLIGTCFLCRLTFLALLLPLLRNWRQGVVAAISGVAALLLGRVAAGGITILLAAIIAAALGVALERIGPRPT